MSFQSRTEDALQNDMGVWNQTTFWTMPRACTNLSLSYLRKALMTLMVVGSEGFWNSRVFFSTSSFRSAPMALPQGFLEEKDKEKLSIPPKASLQTMLNAVKLTRTINGLPYHAAIIVSVCNTNYLINYLEMRRSLVQQHGYKYVQGERL